MEELRTPQLVRGTKGGVQGSWLPYLARLGDGAGSYHSFS